MSGPLPKPGARRRRTSPTPGFKMLPHEGRTGPTPDWPLPVHPDSGIAELELKKWTELWKLPQAVEWERMKCYDDVALYVRTFIQAAMPIAGTETISQVRQLDLKIGVSPRAMRDLRWETDEPLPEGQDEPEGKLEEKKPRTYVPKKGP